MKRLTFVLCTTIVLTVAGCGDEPTTNSAANKDSAAAAKPDSPASMTEAPATPPDTAAMRQAMIAYATPGEMHRMLASADGKWDADVTSWWSPDGPPQKSKGVSTNKMVLGGRYQESTFSGSFGGMPFEGKGTVAYDNTKKVFVSSWMDNMGTGLMIMEGPYDPATKTISFAGTMTDPTTGKECKVREIMTFTDDKHQKMEMFAAPAGQKEYKTMEILFTKK